jgi:hypothetical protein
MAEIGWRAAFIEFDEIKPRDASPAQVLEPRPLNQDGEALTGRVPPTGLLHEAVEDLDFAPARSTAVGETPLENLLVRPANEHPFAQVHVLDVEKREAVTIELAPEIIVISLWKVSACVQADLVEHSRKIDQAANGVVRAAREWLAHYVASGFGRAAQYR